MGRPSSSAETCSDATTVYSYTKDEQPSSQQPARRSLRQKARDVLSDMGSPPTKRQDTKDGRHTSNFADMGLMAGAQQPRV